MWKIDPSLPIDRIETDINLLGIPKYMTGRTTPTVTRRRLVKVGGVVIGSLLAGCSGGEAGGNGTNTSANGSTAVGEGTSSETPGTGKSSATTDGTNSERSYTVRAAPMGAVEFETTPQDLFVGFSQYADMAVALGHGDAVNTIFSPKLADDVMSTYCARLKGVSPNWEDLPDPLGNGFDKERLYELGSDVHFLDPAYVSTQKNWDTDDIEEIAENVGPWFGNFYSGTHDKPPKGYRDSYRYYSLWDLFGKVSKVLREHDRYRKLNAMHSDVLSTIKSKLPPKNQRPTAVRVTLNGDNSGFYTYHLNKPGYWLADTRPLGARDAFAQADWSNLWGEVGYEAMLEADPDVILNLWSISPTHDLGKVRKKITSKPAGRKLTAIKNGRFYPSGMRYQGPVMNLFQLEMTAKQLYPDVFGEWPDYESGDPYPQIPKSERLFDRTKLTSVITGR